VRRLGTEYASDEIKGTRQFGFTDPLSCRTRPAPRREAARGLPRSATGALGQLGALWGDVLHTTPRPRGSGSRTSPSSPTSGPVEGARWRLAADVRRPRAVLDVVVNESA